MPLYYFRLTDGAQVLDNQKGIELAGDAAARDDAIAFAHDVKRGVVMKGWDWNGWFIEIVDANGQKVDQVAIADV